MHLRKQFNLTTGRFKLRNMAGTVLASVAQGNTGGWQVWVTRSVTATLPAGAQTLRIYYTGEGLNLNWFDLTPPSASARFDFESEVENTMSRAIVYPNPIVHTLTIDLNGNNYNKAIVADLAGKTQVSQVIREGESKVEMDFSKFKSGLYIIRLSNGKKYEMHKVIKQ